MNLDKHGKVISKKLSHIVHRGHAKRVIITDKDNNPVLHFPLLFIVLVIVLLPVFAGILIFLFLLSEYHAVMDKAENEEL
jgi:hypothetical protein